MSTPQRRWDVVVIGAGGSQAQAMLAAAARGADVTRWLAHFFTELRKVSRGGGGLALHRLVGGEPRDRIRIRDLLVPAAASA